MYIKIMKLAVGGNSKCIDFCTYIFSEQSLIIFPNQIHQPYHLFDLLALEHKDVGRKHKLGPKLSGLIDEFTILSRPGNLNLTSTGRIELRLRSCITVALA